MAQLISLPAINKNHPDPIRFCKKKKKIIKEQGDTEITVVDTETTFGEQSQNWYQEEIAWKV